MAVSIDTEDRITMLLECNNQLLEANLQANINVTVAWQKQALAFNTYACAMREHMAKMGKWCHEWKLENHYNTVMRAISDVKYFAFGFVVFGHSSNIWLLLLLKCPTFRINNRICHILATSGVNLIIRIY